LDQACIIADFSYMAGMDMPPRPLTAPPCSAPRVPALMQCFCKRRRLMTFMKD
jgi:hypothetical protein